MEDVKPLSGDIQELWPSPLPRQRISPLEEVATVDEVAGEVGAATARDVGKITHPGDVGVQKAGQCQELVRKGPCVDFVFGSPNDHFEGHPSIRVEAIERQIDGALASMA